MPSLNVEQTAERQKKRLELMKRITTEAEKEVDAFKEKVLWETVLDELNQSKTSITNLISRTQDKSSLSNLSNAGIEVEKHIKLVEQLVNRSRERHAKIVENLTGKGSLLNKSLATEAAELEYTDALTQARLVARTNIDEYEGDELDKKILFLKSSLWLTTKKKEDMFKRINTTITTELAKQVPQPAPTQAAVASHQNQQAQPPGQQPPQAVQPQQSQQCTSVTITPAGSPASSTTQSPSVFHGNISKVWDTFTKTISGHNSTYTTDPSIPGPKLNPNGSVTVTLIKGDEVAFLQTLANTQDFTAKLASGETYEAKHGILYQNIQGVMTKIGGAQAMSPQAPSHQPQFLQQQPTVTGAQMAGQSPFLAPPPPPPPMPPRSVGASSSSSSVGGQRSAASPHSSSGAGTDSDLDDFNLTNTSATSGSRPPPLAPASANEARRRSGHGQPPVPATNDEAARIISAARSSPPKRGAAENNAGRGGEGVPDVFTPPRRN